MFDKHKETEVPVIEYPLPVGWRSSVGCVGGLLCRYTGVSLMYDGARVSCSIAWCVCNSWCVCVCFQLDKSCFQNCVCLWVVFSCELSGLVDWRTLMLTNRTWSKRTFEHVCMSWHKVCAICQPSIHTHNGSTCSSLVMPARRSIALYAGRCSHSIVTRCVRVRYDGTSFDWKHTKSNKEKTV